MFSSRLAVRNVELIVASSPAIRIQEERSMHEAKLAKMETEMKLVFQQKVQEKEAKQLENVFFFTALAINWLTCSCSPSDYGNYSK